MDGDSLIAIYDDKHIRAQLITASVETNRLWSPCTSIWTGLGEVYDGTDARWDRAGRVWRCAVEG
jgi:hypothetical protein